MPDTTRRCDDCALIVTDEPLMLVRGNEEDEVQYDLAEWQVGERAAATNALLDVDIPYRWEESLVLTVPAVAEDEVDRLLDELEEVEELEAADDEADEGDELGGDIEAHTAMGDLFVAADRLQHDPTDVRMVADALEAELIVADARTAVRGREARLAADPGAGGHAVGGSAGVGGRGDGGRKRPGAA